MPGEDPRPRPERRAAAYHEAGHAVASWRQGDGIGAVTIAPGTMPDGRPTGGLFLLLRGGDRSAASGWGHRHLVMTLAGPAAQRVHDPCSYVLSCARYDLEEAGNFAFVMSTSREAARALLLWAHAEARARVAADWHLVEALAVALLAETTLTGEAATAILEAADRVRRVDLAAARAAMVDAADL